MLFCKSSALTVWSSISEWSQIYIELAKEHVERIHRVLQWSQINVNSLSFVRLLCSDRVSLSWPLTYQTMLISKKFKDTLCNKFWPPSRALPNTMIVRHYLTFSVFLLWICALYFCPAQPALCSLLGSGGRAHPNTMCSHHTRLLSPVQILQTWCIMFLKHQRCHISWGGARAH